MDFLKSLRYPDEVIALLRFKIIGCESVTPKVDMESLTPHLRQCFHYLKATSRSFAIVIQALDDELRNAVCIFYLVLRALDTIEDDMSIPAETKAPLLRSFHTHLKEKDWRYQESKEKDRVVLEEFPTIARAYQDLDTMYQEVISDICEKMAGGMCKFLMNTINTLSEWDEYCHYVAGLVGIGLSRLFSASGLEDHSIAQDEDLANSMGVFLQKTNIIRDYLEDIEQGRQFWPKEVWTKYARDLNSLALIENSEVALSCLNELITNALGHIPDVMEYMSRLKNQSIFNFCAIPQVMAIGTLERCYNNNKVFSKVVKIRKGEAVQLMMRATSFEKMKSIMLHFIRNIQMRIPKQGQIANITQQKCALAEAVCQSTVKYSDSNFYFPLYISFAMIVSMILWNYWNNVSAIYRQMNS